MYAASGHGALRAAVGKLDFLGPAAKKVVLISLEHLISDAQKQDVEGGASIYEADDVEQNGPYNARPLAAVPFHIEPGSKDVWRVVWLGSECGHVCLVVLLFVLLVCVAPAHPKLSQRATGHTLFIASGGVPSTGSSADVEVEPVVTWCGMPILGGSGGDVLGFVSSQVLWQILMCGFHQASPARIASLLLVGLQAMRQATDKEPVHVHESALVAVTASLQGRVQLQLDEVRQAAAGVQLQPGNLLKEVVVEGKGRGKKKEVLRVPVSKAADKDLGKAWKTHTYNIESIFSEARTLVDGRRGYFLSATGDGSGGLLIELVDGVAWTDLKPTFRAQLGGLAAVTVERWAAAHPNEPADRWRLVKRSFRFHQDQGNSTPTMDVPLGTVVDGIHSLWQRHECGKHL